MKQVSVRKLRDLIARNDEILAAEGELVVTNRGRPVARVLPISRRTAMPSQAKHRARMPFQETGSDELIRQDRNAR